MSTTSVDDRYGKGCRGKILYKSRKEACRAATRLKKLIKERTGLTEPIESYHCVTCHGWHVGHPKNWWFEKTGGARPRKAR